MYNQNISVTVGVILNIWVYGCYTEPRLWFPRSRSGRAARTNSLSLNAGGFIYTSANITVVPASFSDVPLWNCNDQPSTLLWLDLPSLYSFSCSYSASAVFVVRDGGWRSIFTAHWFRIRYLFHSKVKQSLSTTVVHGMFPFWTVQVHLLTGFSIASIVRRKHPMSLPIGRTKVVFKHSSRPLPMYRYLQ